jgi:hypothetical protein
LTPEIKYIVTDEKCLPPLPTAESLDLNVNLELVRSIRPLSQILEENESQSTLQNESTLTNELNDSQSILQFESTLTDVVITPEMVEQHNATLLANRLELELQNSTNSLSGRLAFQTDWSRPNTPNGSGSIINSSFDID